MSPYTISMVAITALVLLASMVIVTNRGVVSGDAHVHQLTLEIETMTEDELFVRMEVTVDYAALPALARDARFSAEEVTRRLSEGVVASIQTRIPAIRLCEIFERTDELTASLRAEAVCIAGRVGYALSALTITDIAPRMSRGSLPNRARVTTVHSAPIRPPRSRS